MMIKVVVSIGELIDKYTILLIKEEKIHDSSKAPEITKEREFLEESILELRLPKVEGHIKALKEVNQVLWDIEDKIRLKEKQKSFDDEFIELARKVYLTNDERFKLKNNVNADYGSEINEMKSYEEY